MPRDKTNGLGIGAGHRIGALLPAAAVSLLALAGGAAAGYAPPITGEIAVIFPPWTDEAGAFGAVIAAGGRIVGPSRFGNIVVAEATDPGFGGRVRAAGAWLTLRATGLCSTLPQPAVGIDGTTGRRG